MDCPHCDKPIDDRLISKHLATQVFGQVSGGRPDHTPGSRMLKGQGEETKNHHRAKERLTIKLSGKA